MTLVAMWLNEENPAHASLWVVSDSRISGGPGGAFLDEGAKLFSLPISCRGPAESGLFSPFNPPYFSQGIALAGAGNTLVFHHVYATIVPILGALIAIPTNVPTLEDVADAAARITTMYVRSLGQNWSRNPHRVELALGGYCHPDSEHEAYRLTPEFEDGMFSQFAATKLSLQGGEVHLFGDQRDEAHFAIEQRRSDHPKDIAWHRAPEFIVREFVNDDDQYPTIGGDVQIGYTVGHTFIRGATVSPKAFGQPAAVMKFNNIDLEEIGLIGPCRVGISSMSG